MFFSCPHGTYKKNREEIEVQSAFGDAICKFVPLLGDGLLTLFGGSCTIGPLGQAEKFSTNQRGHLQMKFG